MRNNNKIKIFDEAYARFLSEDDPALHYKAMKILLSEVDLDKCFDEMGKRDEVKKFFLMWQESSKYEKDPIEKENLKRMGIESKLLYNQGSYQKLADLFFNITLRHIANYIHLEERKDYNEITDHDLYTKNLIPEEIYLQFFLMETMIKRKDFDWDRGEKISNQNLACFVTCFIDINAYINENEYGAE